MLLPEAETTARRAMERIRERFPELRDVQVAGRLRRGCQIVEEVVLVALADAAQHWPRSQFIPQLAARLAVCDASHLGIALLYTTGSQQHLEQLQDLAAKKGLRLTDSGLWSGPREILCRDEAEVYTAVGLPFIDPELREGAGEIEAALAGRLPPGLGAERLRGVLHTHTEWSDGRCTVPELATAAQSRGFSYCGLAEHVCGVHRHGCMDLARLPLLRRHVDDLNAGVRAQGFELFLGAEADMDLDGLVPLPMASLQDLDYVVCGMHDGFSLSKEQQTSRIVRAVQHPAVFMLAHPTGRLRPENEGGDVGMDVVLRACASYGVVVEINANPRRLDLDWRWHQRALDMGCLFCISPDAHAVDELDHVRWGLAAAHKGGIPPDRLLNFMSSSDVGDLMRAKRTRAGLPCR